MQNFANKYHTAHKVKFKYGWTNECNLICNLFWLHSHRITIKYDTHTPSFINEKRKWKLYEIQIINFKIFELVFMNHMCLLFNTHRVEKSRWIFSIQLFHEACTKIFITHFEYHVHNDIYLEIRLQNLLLCCVFLLVFLTIQFFLNPMNWSRQIAV